MHMQDSGNVVHLRTLADSQSFHFHLSTKQAKQLNPPSQQAPPLELSARPQACHPQSSIYNLQYKGIRWRHIETTTTTTTTTKKCHLIKKPHDYLTIIIPVIAYYCLLITGSSLKDQKVCFKKVVAKNQRKGPVKSKICCQDTKWSGSILSSWPIKSSNKRTLMQGIFKVRPSTTLFLFSQNQIIWADSWKQ